MTTLKNTLHDSNNGLDYTCLLYTSIPFPDVESEEIQESAHAETDPLVLEMQEDVYKRQVRTVRYTAVSTVDVHRLISCGTVSYTHLDVYKRQDRDHAHSVSRPE